MTNDKWTDLPNVASQAAAPAEPLLGEISAPHRHNGRAAGFQDDGGPAVPFRPFGTVVIPPVARGARVVLRWFRTSTAVSGAAISTLERVLTSMKASVKGRVDSS